MDPALGQQFQIAGAVESDIAVSALLPLLPERELPKFAKDWPHHSWLRPGEIKEASKPSSVGRDRSKSVLGIPVERWSIHSVRCSPLVDTDWFLSGLCCVASAAPATLRLVFRDENAADGGVDDSMGKGKHSGDAGEHEDEAIRPGAPSGLVNVSLFRDGEWVTTQIDDRLPCSRAGELLAPHCESDEEGGGQTVAIVC